MEQTKDSPFIKYAIAAFPYSCQQVASAAAYALAPSVNTQYRKSSFSAVVEGHPIQVPQRIHFLAEARVTTPMQAEVSLAIQCLLSRSTDGHIRQAALRQILPASENWVIPFIVLLSGEYVVEIVEDIYNWTSTLDVTAYANFVRENRSLMRALRAKAVSYWNCYYRHTYPDNNKYPGLMFLHQLERWAA